MDRPVEFDKVTACIEAGHYAPSAGNLQDWKFILVTDVDLRKSIAEHCMEQYWMAQAPVHIVVCANEERTELRYGLRGKRLYSIQSCAAATENILLAAYSLGLGSCWVGAFDEDFLIRTLDIPPWARPQGVITLGYPDEKPERKQLTSLQSLVYFNGFGARLEKPHLVLRDYSVEWESKARQAGPFLKKSLAGLKKNVQQLKEQVDEQKKKKDEHETEENTEDIAHRG